ncbi:transposase [Streptomyces hypolithicus]
MAKRNWRTVALAWNAEGQLTRTGKQWTGKNARRVMLSEATLNSRIIWRGKDAARRPDGSLIFGEQVIIKLPKVFEKAEAQELRHAAEPAPKRPRSNGRVYILSGLLTSPCGSVYRGHKRRHYGSDYRCRGREERFAGSDSGCTCPALDVDAIEGSVWRDLVELLADADRLKAMAQDWIGARAGEHVDHVSRIAQLDQQIAEQAQVLNATIAVAARQAAARGLGDAEVEAAAEAAIRPLNEDLMGLEKLRGEAVAWQRDGEDASRRAQDFERLAEAARTDLGGLTPELRAELLQLLELRAEVVRCAPRRQGVACRITDWFTTRERLVPELTDDAWRRVEPLLKGRSDAAPKRPTLEALLLKARTGVRFKDLPGEYGNPASLQTQANRWRASGAWDAAMDLLKDEPGAPAWRPDPVEIKVTLRPLAIESSIGGGDR